MAKKEKSNEILIKQAVTEGIKAGRLLATSETKNAYKDTEKRLFAHTVLLEKNRK